MTRSALAVGARSPVCIAWAEQMRQGGWSVLGQSLEPLPQDAWNDTLQGTASNVLARLESDGRSFDSILFDFPDADEHAGTAADRPDVVAESVLDFLICLQTAARMQVHAGKGQIWVLVREPSIRSYVPLPCAPILGASRVSIVRSVAKELMRFNVRINVAMVQAAAEEASQDAWKNGRNGLKAYAMKFKPAAAASLATPLVALCGIDALPMAGLSLNLGIGMPDGGT